MLENSAPDVSKKSSTDVLKKSSLSVSKKTTRKSEKLTGEVDRVAETIYFIEAISTATTSNTVRGNVFM